MTASERPYARDAGGTRRRLLEAGRSRFALDGYAATTVRDIASDAGVTVALINRYFDSKEGLFEACLQQVAVDLSQRPKSSENLDEAVERIVGQLVERSSGQPSAQLVLLLRSSGDPGAEQIRRDTLHSFAQSLVTTASSRTEDEQDLLLRAQVILSAVIGMALLRSTSALEPLASATIDHLRTPVRDLVAALLGVAETGVTP